MILIEAKPIGFDKVAKALAKIPEKARKGVSMAINSAVRKGRTTVGRHITAKYVISRAKVYEGLAMTFSNPGSLYGALNAVGPGIPVKDFKVSPKGPQPRRKPIITVEIVRGAGKAFPGGFVVGAFGMHVFTRKSRSRFPIEKKRSVSVPQMMLGLRAGEPIKTEISEHFNKEADRQISRILK